MEPRRRKQLGSAHVAGMLNIGCYESETLAMFAQLKHAVGTAVGRPRRWRFLQSLPQGGVVAEIGVFRGQFIPEIIGVTRPSRLHLIDGWWELYGERYPDWGPYTDYGRLRTRDAFQEAKEAALGANCEFHVGDDLEILSVFADGYFDWVYLDTSHQYQHTLDELEVLRRKVKPEGLIAGDDWIEDPANVNHGVCRAVREFCSENDWQLGPVDSFGQWSISQPDCR